jgi:hypothetical protein
MSAFPIAPHPFDQPTVIDGEEMHRLKNTPIAVPDWLTAKLDEATRQYRNQDFPAAIYRLVRSAAGTDRVDSRLVQSESERQEYLAKGWATSPADAKDADTRYQEGIAYQAAMRAKDDLRLGEKATAELEAAEDAAEDHVLDVQPAPKRGPGRPRAVTA